MCAGFRKARSSQAALKIGMYGPPGSGKTFTALLASEGLAARENKRIAFVDTEEGTSFYCQDVADRKVHPEAFDFDALYSRSLTEAAAAIQGLDPEKYGIVVIDSITHLWDAAKAAYEGRVNAAGQIPFHAWGKIKKPYKDLIAFLLSLPMHVILCGRQGLDYGEDTETGETRVLGKKMKAEGETPYEPHILLAMEAVRQPKGQAVITAFAEKDRTGVLAGKTFPNPTYESLILPVVSLLNGGDQAKIPTADEVASQDAEAISETDRLRAKQSLELMEKFSARLLLASTLNEVKTIGKELTATVKKKMTTEHVSELRKSYLNLVEKLGG